MTGLAAPMRAGAISEKAPTRKGRFAHVDALRALAVLLVVFSHAGLETVIPGSTGVTIFFAISGFVITYVLLRERDRTGGFGLGGFYVRRVLKLLPPFVVVILLPTLVYALWAPIAWNEVLAHLVLIKTIEPSLANWPLAIRVSLQASAGVLLGVVLWRLVEVPVLRLKDHLKLWARRSDRGDLTELAR